MSDSVYRLLDEHDAEHAYLAEWDMRCRTCVFCGGDLVCSADFDCTAEDHLGECPMTKYGSPSTLTGHQK